MTQNAWLIPLLPLIAFVIIIFISGKAKLLSAVIALTSVTASFIISVMILWDSVVHHQTMDKAIEWLNLSSAGSDWGLKIQMGILIDPLSSVMLFIVTFVAMLVMLYSIGYMKEDEGFSRYFAYLSLFTFSMLGLVVSNNYFQMFVFWELVGLSSYLLIGFWFHKTSAADAGKKAFITNRWADFGFMVGIILLFVTFGTFNFNELSPLISNSKDAGLLILIGILVFFGPIGKSAQFPLHVWLPDAMEGPTPISALIHAATMVAAGVFLIARGYILFASSETVLMIIAYIGGFTALFAASIALVQKDIKRILAFSTLSQLGYMVMALGMGSMTSGMFHLTTHAFFKALLFLGAGSVIHALHKQDIFEMGGLRKKMPVTTWTFIIGSLALSGIFPLAGFWSKDEILVTTLHSHFTSLGILAFLVSFMTSFYMFRLIFKVFFGENNSKHAVHESPLTMKLPLLILAFFSIFAGLVNSPWFYNTFHISFGSFVFFGEAEKPHMNYFVVILSTILSLSGITLAWLIYIKKAVNVEALRLKFNKLYLLLYNKYYIDEFYQWLYDRLMLMPGKLFDWVDHHIIDGLFDGLANRTRISGKKMSYTQTGALQNYALVMFAAVVIIILLLAIPLNGGVFK